MEYAVNLSYLPGVLLAGHSGCPSGWSLTGRRLEEAEIIVVYSGVLRCIVDGNPLFLREGDACLVPPHLPVDQYAEGGPCRFFYIHVELNMQKADAAFKQRIVSNYVNRPSDMEPGFFFLPPLKPENTVVCVGQKMQTGSYKNEIFTLFQRLLLERNRETVHSTLLIALEAAQILALLGQCWLRQTVPPAETPTGREQNKLVQDALLYLHSHFSAPLRVADLAEQLKVSQQYLTRLFRTETGLSPIKYLNHLRIEKAKEYMRTTQMNISEAASACGFDNIYYFSRLFKQLEGMPPSAYRAWLNSKSNQ